MIVGHPAAVDICANEPETCPGLPVMLGLTVVSASRLPSTAIGPKPSAIATNAAVIMRSDIELSVGRCGLASICTSRHALWAPLHSSGAGSLRPSVPEELERSVRLGR